MHTDDTVEFDVPPQHAARPSLEAHFTALLAAHHPPATIVLLVGNVLRPAPGDLHRLGRMAVLARRTGHRVVLRGAGPRLRLLLDLTGLTDALPEG
ncbi:hypothetical protein [Kitasatospora sp. CB01950]|uniref:hypothetical protein n=1 Tax=Kitasatospora sp. CB01950 TaxID=1703930 RepID=UPI00093D411F|nr:hypothetical protein [Kitasatospora sp. CB01950]OKI99120.1 hypothetical protein AMK19_31505 [Kitasatospora sp. CB01950]